MVPCSTSAAIAALVEHTHYIQANGGTVATIKRSGTSVTNTTRYLHQDHLGSVVAITNESGAIVESLAYDAWGKRRPAGTWQTPSPGVFMAVIELRRGFTLHEHLDHVGLIHMGGRVYDPELGRFLSADPFVQFPASTQGFNRYAYVSNNPLSYTDPSGNFLKKLGRALALPAAVFIPNPILAGAVAGYLGSGGDLKAAALGAVGGAVFHSIGNHFGEVGFGTAAHLQKTLAHGMAGGLLSKAGGGRFGDGFLGAAAGQIAAPGIDGIGRGANGQIATDPASRLARVVSAAAVGGTASTIGGGKFANGAISAGFARAMNDERHLRSRTRLMGTGGNLHVGYGVEVAASVVITTGDEFDVGFALHIGHGPGLHVSADIYGGLHEGNAVSLLGKSTNLNAHVKALSVSLVSTEAVDGIYHPTSSGVIGIGVGLPGGASRTTLYTVPFTVRSVSLGYQWAVSRATDVLCSASGNC